MRWQQQARLSRERLWRPLARLSVHEALLVKREVRHGTVLPPQGALSSFMVQLQPFIVFFTASSHQSVVRQPDEGTHYRRHAPDALDGWVEEERQG